MKDFKSFLIGFLMLSSMYAGFFEGVENPNGKPGLITIGMSMDWHDEWGKNTSLDISKEGYLIMPVLNIFTLKMNRSMNIVDYKYVDFGDGWPNSDYEWIGTSYEMVDSWFLEFQ